MQSASAMRKKGVAMDADTAGLTVGMDVLGADSHRIGEVKEVRASEFVIDRTLQPDVAVPHDTIQEIATDSVVLNITAEDVDDLFWAHAGEDVQVNLHGIYD